jgi:hypothetical protein
MAASPFSAAMSGSTPITSITATDGPTSIASGKQILGDDHVIEAVSVEKVDPKKTQGGWKKS